MIDFTDVTLDIPTSLLATNYSCSDGYYQSVLIEGDGNTLINGEFINTYPDGDLFVSDFKTHNEDSDRRPYKSNTYVRVWGDNTTLKNNSFVVRGSFPYGYGDMFGKGSENTFGLKKHCGILVSADDVLIDGVNILQLAFCHALFMQGSDNTTIRNTTIQGRVRMGADMYKDGEDSLPDQVDYLQQEPDWYEGDAAFTHITRMPYGTVSGITMDITLVEPGFVTGPYNFTNIAGSDHNITFRSDGQDAVGDHKITVGYSRDRWDDTSYHEASNVTLTNYTDHEEELTEYAEGNTIYSNGAVEDNGSSNSVEIAGDEG